MVFCLFLVCFRTFLPKTFAYAPPTQCQALRKNDNLKQELLGPWDLWSRPLWITCTAGREALKSHLHGEFWPLFPSLEHHKGNIAKQQGSVAFADCKPRHSRFQKAMNMNLHPSLNLQDTGQKKQFYQLPTSRDPAIRRFEGVCRSVAGI